MKEITLLKLGGSLITDKDQPHTARLDVISRIVEEIEHALSKNTEMLLIIGHGSGSYGHVPAKSYRTRDGVKSNQEWKGFAEVWNEARALNQIMINAFQQARLPVIAFPPSAAAISHGRRKLEWNIRPIQLALENGLIPLIHGDVLFDEIMGGTIFSTEELFESISTRLRPKRVLLAGIEPGIWRDYPKNTELEKVISATGMIENEIEIQGSRSIDVTGGMREKVSILMRIILQNPTCQGAIFSGMIPGNVEKCLSGEIVGTIFKYD